MRVLRILILCSLCAVAATACEKNSWSQAASLPQGFRPEGVLALGKGVALVGGATPHGEGISRAHVASIFRVEGGAVVEAFSMPQAGVFRFARHGQAVWALLRHETETGRRERIGLLVSRDQGRRWEEVGSVPENAESLFAVGPSELWVLGVETLLRSADAGRSWERVESPGRRSQLDDQVVRLASGKVAIIGKGVLVRDASGAFVRTVSEDVTVLCADGDLIAARASGELRAGRLDAAGNLDRWLGKLPEETTPFACEVAGSKMRILALGKESAVPLSGIRLLSSSDGGKRWSSARVDAQAWPDFAALGPRGSGVAVGLQNEVFVPR